MMRTMLSLPVRPCRGLMAALLAAALLAVPAPALAQNCDADYAELQTAQSDSRQALSAATAQLDAFASALAGPRAVAPPAVEATVTARDDLDAYIAALDEFTAQLGPSAQACGEFFAAEQAGLVSLIGEFEVQRDRANRLLAEHDALIAAGEPAMDAATMQAVQARLAELGFYPGPADGQFGAEVRAAIQRWQQANGMPVTGFLTAAERDALLDTVPPVPQIVAPLQPGTPGPTASAECASILADVESSNAEAQAFRTEIGGNLDGFLAAIRGPRRPPIRDNVATQASEALDAHLLTLEDLYREADQLEELCGAELQAATAVLLDHVVALRNLEERATDLVEQYTALVQSNEPEMTAAEMRAVQQALLDLQHYRGAVDAVFGPRTRAAIEEFQREIGADATGYLTAEQRDRLLNEAAARQAAAAEPPFALPVVPLKTLAAAWTDDDVRDELPPAIRADRETASRFDLIYDRMVEYAEQGDYRLVLSQRYPLFGAAYLDHGPVSREMVDAHSITAHAHFARGEFAEAAALLSAGLAILDALDVGLPLERAWLLERLATIQLAQAVDAAGSEPFIPEAAYASITETLGAAAALADAELGLDDPVAARILDRLADVHVAANVAPADERVEMRIVEKFGG